MEQETKRKVGRPRGIQTPYKSLSITVPATLHQRFFTLSHKSKQPSDRAFLEKLLDMYESRNKE